jgi:protoporphyrinogen oxidase
MPLSALARVLDPAPPAAVLDAASSLRYRDFLTVGLIVERADIFPDTWLYVHAPEVKLGRIQNFKNWSPEMVPDESQTCLGMEYFCFEGDGLWERRDEDLIALATKELAALGLADGAGVVDGAVVRMPKAYPIYDAAYRGHLDVVRSFLDGIPNLQTIGRNGMHKYNNQDHSMQTAMLAVENLEGAEHDLWATNTDFDYHEEQRIADAPARRPAQPPIPGAPARARRGPGDGAPASGNTERWVAHE